MFDILDIESAFNNKKDIIIEVLTDYYGEEYADIIKEKIEDTLFIFRSKPEEEYRYVESHKGQVSRLNALLIETKYHSQKAIEEEIRKKSMDYIFTAVSVTFFGGRLEQKYENEVVKLFSDSNFNAGQIDSFSTKSIEILNNPNANPTIKASIKYDQEMFRRAIDAIGLKLNIDKTLVDKFIEIRKKCQKEYRDKICRETPYIKDISKAIIQKYGIPLPPGALHNYAFLQGSFAQNITGRKKDVPFSINVIRIPIIDLMNRNAKGLDVEIIHEIIHRIETNKNRVGISNNDKNIIMNEIRTQWTAVKIVKKLHENGIFIFDNPLDCKVEGESLYETLFPVTEELLKEYETLFKECAINNDPETINNTLGEEWDKYSKLVDVIYKDIRFCFDRLHKQYPAKLTLEIAEMIIKMKEHEKRGSKHV